MILPKAVQFGENGSPKPDSIGTVAWCRGYSNGLFARQLHICFEFVIEPLPQVSNLRVATRQHDVAAGIEYNRTDLPLMYQTRPSMEFWK